jgi:hypothetical protein
VYVVCAPSHAVAADGAGPPELRGYAAPPVIHAGYAQAPPAVRDGSGYGRVPGGGSETKAADNKRASNTAYDKAPKK